MRAGARRVLGGLAAAAVLGAIGVAWWAARPRAEAPALPIAASIAAVAARTLNVITPEVRARSTAPAASTASTAGAAPRVLAADELELCGIGVIKGVRMKDQGDNAQPDGSVPPPIYQAPQAWVTESAAAAWPLLHAALRARGDAPSLAVTLRTPVDIAAEVPASAPAQVRTAGPGLPRLVELARSSGDPLVLQWAVAECQREPGHAACAGFGVRHWLQREPRNAMAWLWLLATEPGAADEALHGLAGAREANSHWGEFGAIVEQALPADLPGVVGQQLLVEATGIDAATLMPPFNVLIDQCTPPRAAADANRRQQCEAIAQMLVEHSDTQLVHVIGIRLGQNAGWPAERVAALRAEHKALLDAGVRAMLQMYGDIRSLYACAAVERGRGFVRDRARDGGELPHARKLLAAERAASAAAR